MNENPKIYPSPSDPAEPVTPVIYEEDVAVFEYKHLEHDLQQAEPLSEEELNKFGNDNWELIAVFTHNDTAHYYFKRLKMEK